MDTKWHLTVVSISTVNDARHVITALLAAHRPCCAKGLSVFPLIMLCRSCFPYCLKEFPKYSLHSLLQNNLNLEKSGEKNTKRFYCKLPFTHFTAVNILSHFPYHPHSLCLSLLLSFFLFVCNSFSESHQRINFKYGIPLFINT